MKPKPQKTILPNFLKEFAKNGLTPPLALEFLYGSWDVYGFAGFIPKDYSRYSTKARKEVVKAVFAEDMALSPETHEDRTLQEACTGLLSVALKNPMPKDGKLGVLKELDLWKEWGVGEALINAWVADSVDSRMFPKGITEIDPQVLNTIIEYANVHISKESYDYLLERIDEVTLGEKTKEVLRCIEARVR